MASLGVILLEHLGLITGQISGLALLISYLTKINFSIIYFFVNIPFYWLALRQLGSRFTIKTIISVASLSTVTYFMPVLIQFKHVNPIFGAILFGFITGAGLLALFRHNASLGGIGILAIYIQNKTGFRAGLTQLSFDVILFSTALFFFNTREVIISLLGSIVLNTVLAINHKSGRYAAY